MSGAVLALQRHPDQWAKLRDNPALLPAFVQETIRWQTPVIHMRRTAREDAELGGQRIRAGDKVVMWYVSGNRDEEAIDDPEGFVIDRPRPRHHLSFGSGIHRCVGDRLAEVQLQILWDEVLKRDLAIEVMGEPVRAYSNFLRGIKALPVRIAG
jgi:cytochrome P450